MRYHDNTNNDYSLFDSDDNVLDNNKKVKTQKKVINDLNKRIKDLKERLFIEKDINMSIHQENVKLMYERDAEKESLMKLLRYLAVVYDVQTEMNDAVTGDTTSEHIRFAIKYANYKYLEQLISLLPMSDSEEDIAKVEAYRNKLRQQNLLDNEDYRDTPPAPFSCWDGNQSDLGATGESLFGSEPSE